MDNILDSIKSLLGIDAVDFSFDQEIIMHINSIFSTLNQLGVGPSDGFKITDDKTLWTAFTEERIDIEFIKSYIYLKVRLLFDPPQNSFLVKAIEDQTKELEWRIQLQVEPYTLTAEEEAEDAPII